MAGDWGEVEAILAAGVEAGVYSAAVLVAGKDGRPRCEAAAGRLSQSPAAPPATPDTVFDLASLTKPLATAAAVMILVRDGRLTLATRLGEVWPGDGLPEDKRPLSLEALLTHTAGLPDWKPFYSEVLAAPSDERRMLPARLAAHTPLAHPPGTATLYSDLGYMLLQAAVEAAAGTDLDSFCRREIYRPLGLAGLGFCPRRRPGGTHEQYAATETGLIPGRDRPGEVHDENAWAAGGVAGHAGLFGTGREVFTLMATLYRGWRGEDTVLGPPELVQRFLTRVPGTSRTPGFDTPAAQNASCGRFFTPDSVGHLGFTGTSAWLDLTTGQLVMLLTNRVHLGRENFRIRPFRPRVHEAASRALGCAPAGM